MLLGQINYGCWRCTNATSLAWAVPSGPMDAMVPLSPVKGPNCPLNFGIAHVIQGRHEEALLTDAVSVRWKEPLAPGWLGAKI